MLDNYQDIKKITFSEYLDIVDPDRIKHSSSAYNYDTEKLNQFVKKDDFPNILKQFEQNGLRFQLREKKVDLAEQQYIKTETVPLKNDKGEILKDKKGNTIYDTIHSRDENFNLIHYSFEEKIELLGKNRFQYEHCIYNQTEDIIVGYTADEWNCLLVVIAEEYQNLGLGLRLLAANREKDPNRYSGGYTPAGKNSEYSHYCSIIKKALTEGYYTKSINEGILSKEKTFEILKSAGIIEDEISIKKNKSKKQTINLNFIDSDDLLVSITDGTVIVYNKNIFDLIENQNQYNNPNLDFFINKCILGYGHISEFPKDNITQLLDLEGRNFEIKKKILEILLNLEYQHSHVKIKLEHQELLEGLDYDIISDKEYKYYRLKERTLSDIQISLYNLVENTFRNNKDEYDEKWCIIQELAYQYGIDKQNITNTKTKILNPEYYITNFFSNKSDLNNAIRDIINKQQTKKGNTITFRS